MGNVHGLSTDFSAGRIARHKSKPPANNRGPLVAGVRAWDGIKSAGSQPSWSAAIIREDCSNM